MLSDTCDPHGTVTARGLSLAHWLMADLQKSFTFWGFSGKPPLFPKKLKSKDPVKLILHLFRRWYGVARCYSDSIRPGRVKVHNTSGYIALVRLEKRTYARYELYFEVLPLRPFDTTSLGPRFMPSLPEKFAQQKEGKHTANLPTK